MNWTDERVEKLKKLWSEGLSASQIAAQLGGVSRNAVIGKVHRLNLPGRAKAGGNASAGRPAVKRPAAPAAPRAATTFQARPAPARATVRAVGATALKDDMDIEALEQVEYKPSGNVVVPIARRLALTDLTERTCKWPVGDPLTDEFHFCGCESQDSSPYCKYHARLAYQPAHDRRKAAARV